jgi:hypothetical protein
MMNFDITTLLINYTNNPKIGDVFLKKDAANLNYFHILVLGK